MNDDYIPGDFLDEGERVSEEAQDACIESELPPFKYDPLAHRLNHQRIRQQSENDDLAEIAAENRRAVLAGDRRNRLWWFCRDVEPVGETSFDRIAQGRSAT